MKKLSTEEFIQKSREVWGDKYDYSLVKYITSKKKVKIMYDGWIFEQSPENHLLGKLCENRWTTERFIFDSLKIHGDKYDYTLVNFKNMNTPIDIIFNGIIYKQTPSKHLMGRKVERNKLLRTNDEFIKCARNVWGDKYDYSLTEYKGSHIPVKIIFDGKVYTQKPSIHLQKYNCETDIIHDQDDFIRKSKIKHGGKYDYSKVRYKNSNTKVIIIFNGLEYQQSPNNHLRGGLLEQKNNKKTTKQFIDESNSIHDFKYTYNNVNYINNHTKVSITCTKHGDWMQSPISHQKGHGCPHCMESKGEQLICKYLNYINISYDKQHRFSNCRGVLHPLPFDFYIPSKRICIEFDGEQHFYPIKHFGGVESFNKLKINDKIKSDYCEDNFITLVRVKYDQIDKINEILKLYF